MGASYAELRGAAQHLDALGYDSVWVWDHYVSWGDPADPVLEGLTTLAGLGEATGRIRLGRLVANMTNRHPGRLAKIAATIQEISGGRLELGVGGGGYEYEQRIFGIDQGALAARTGRVVEALEIIPRLWSGAPVTYAGEHYRLEGAIVAPAPSPRPPIIVGARGPALCRAAGRLADGLNLQWRDREKLPGLLAALDAGLAEAGRTRAGFDLSVHVGWGDLGDDLAGRLAEWEGMGFTRCIAYASAPFPLAGFEAVAAGVG
jgi:alkanesulfonate monooxygenase SsuD/methylene tetrahydromethanopterin reductase-like flavin-dependent oxidoreductase (luciferase family)